MNTISRITTASTVSVEALQQSTKTELSPFQVGSKKDSLETQIKDQENDELSQRYGPHALLEPFSKRMSNLSPEQRIVYGNIKSTWQEQGTALNLPRSQFISDELVWRVTRFCDFDYTASLAMLKRMRPSQWNAVNGAILSKEYHVTQACTILPGLKTHAAQDVVYVYLARFTKQTCADPLRLLTYTMNACYERYQDPAECKIALLINLQDYHITDDSSFQFNEWLAFLELLQGQQGPLKATRVFLVYAEAEFKQAWDTHLAKHSDEAFQWRISFVQDGVELIEYLNPGSEQYLPMDFPQGQRPVKDLVEDFLEYRQGVEQVLEKHSRPGHTKKTDDAQPLDIVLDKDFKNMVSDHPDVDLLFESLRHEPTSPKPTSGGRRRGSVESDATAKTGNIISSKDVRDTENPNTQDSMSGISSPRNNASPVRVTRRYKPGVSALEKKDIEVDCLDRPPSPAKMGFTRGASYRQGGILQDLPELPLSPTENVSDRNNKSAKVKSSSSSSSSNSNSSPEESIVSDNVVTTTSRESTTSTNKRRKSPRKKKSSLKHSAQKNPTSSSSKHLIPDSSPKTHKSSRKARLGDSGSTPTKKRHNDDIVASGSPNKGSSEPAGSSPKLNTSPSKIRHNRDIAVPASPRSILSERPTSSPTKNRHTQDIVAPASPRKNSAEKSSPSLKLTASPSKRSMQTEGLTSSRKVGLSPTKNSTDFTPVSSPIKSTKEPTTPIQQLMQEISAAEQDETYSPYSPSRATRERMMHIFRSNEEEQQKCASPKKSPAKKTKDFAGGCQGVRWQSLEDIQSIPDIVAPARPSFESPATKISRPLKANSLRGLFHRIQSSSNRRSKESAVNSTEDNADKAVPDQFHAKSMSRRRLFNRGASVPVMDGAESSSNTSRTELSPSRFARDAEPMKKRSSLRNLFRKALSFRTRKETDNRREQPLPAKVARRGSTLEVTLEE